MTSLAIRRDFHLLQDISQPLKKTVSGRDTRTMTVKVFGTHP